MILETVMTFINGQKSNHHLFKIGFMKNADDADLASRAIDLFKKDLGIDVPVKETKSSSKTKSAADMVSTKTTAVEPKQEKIWSERRLLQ